MLNKNLDKGFVKNSIKFNNCLLVVDKNVPKKMTLLIKKPEKD